MTLAERIRKYRNRREMSMKDAASASGLSYPYWTELERGIKTPTFTILEQIAAGLGVSIQSLVADEDDVQDAIVWYSRLSSKVKTMLSSHRAEDYLTLLEFMEATPISPKTMLTLAVCIWASGVELMGNEGGISIVREVMAQGTYWANTIMNKEEEM